MCNGYQSGNSVVDETDLQAKLLQNKIGQVIQDEFVKEIKRLITGEARKCCEDCEIDDPSQLHDECLMTDEEELWICHYDAAKKISILNLNKLWSAIEREILTELDVYLEDSWLSVCLSVCQSVSPSISQSVSQSVNQ